MPDDRVLATGAGAMMDKLIVNIVGERVALGPIQPGHAAIDYGWVNDLPSVAPLGLYRPRALEQQEAYFQEMAAATDAVVFAIYPRDGWRPIGSARLSEINYFNGTAEFGILIGDVSARGQGYGTEATALVLGYAFTALGLRNVMLRVYSYNLAGPRVYQKGGFREIGRASRSSWPGSCGTQSTWTVSPASSSARCCTACSFRTSREADAHAGAAARTLTMCRIADALVVDIPRAC